MDIHLQFDTFESMGKMRSFPVKNEHQWKLLLKLRTFDIVQKNWGLGISNLYLIVGLLLCYVATIANTFCLTFLIRLFDTKLWKLKKLYLMTHCMHWLKACIGKKTNDNFLFLAACHGAFHFDAFAVDQQSSTVQ